jgi:hypothetical protein
MILPNYKALIKLANACRKAGIKHYKDSDCEFTLTDDAPQSAYKKRQKSQPKVVNSDVDLDVQTDALTQEQLLLWSAGNIAGDVNENQ